MTWYWTDDLARLLQAAKKIDAVTLNRWLSGPVAVRGTGEALEVAESLLAAEEEEPHLAA
jgi:hypothetical protein